MVHCAKIVLKFVAADDMIPIGHCHELSNDTIAQFSNDDFLVIVVIRDRYFSVIGSLAR